MADKKNNLSNKNKSGINNEVDDLKRFIDKNKKQKRVLIKILKKMNQFRENDETA